VRGTGQHLALLREQGFDGSGRLIKTLSERGDLVAADHRHAVAEIAHAPATRALGQLFETTGDASGKGKKPDRHQNGSATAAQEQRPVRPDVHVRAGRGCGIPQMRDPDRTVLPVLPTARAAREGPGRVVPGVEKQPPLHVPDHNVGTQLLRLGFQKLRLVAPTWPGASQTSERAMGARIWAAGIRGS